jgi:hypothetical protein
LGEQANLGGTPTSMGLVKAYIRIVEKGSGPLDFDAHGGMDTTWQRIYLALRAGFHSEAVEVCTCPTPPFFFSLRI